MSTDYERYLICLRCVGEEECIVNDNEFPSSVVQCIKLLMLGGHPWLNPWDVYAVSLLNNRLNLTSRKQLCIGCPYILEHVTLAQEEIVQDYLHFMRKKSDEPF